MIQGSSADVEPKEASTAVTLGPVVAAAGVVSIATLAMTATMAAARALRWCTKTLPVRTGIDIEAPCERCADPKLREGYRTGISNRWNASAHDPNVDDRPRLAITHA
jgi:hypothetical protein